ncbi:MAG TPA: hypothetical protein VHH11_14030 [Gammaproteobacteria bacterium]|nr:hypothetical protein [Gammaproteobacteria bacterium]
MPFRESATPSIPAARHPAWRAVRDISKALLSIAAGMIAGAALFAALAAFVTSVRACEQLPGPPCRESIKEDCPAGARLVPSTPPSGEMLVRCVCDTPAPDGGLR